MALLLSTQGHTLRGSSAPHAGSSKQVFSTHRDGPPCRNVTGAASSHTVRKWKGWDWESDSSNCPQAHPS